MIDVVCRAASHPGRVAKIASFFPREPMSVEEQASLAAQDPNWRAESFYYDVIEGEPGRWAVDTVVSRANRASTPADFSVDIRRGEGEPRRRPDGRWSLACRLCGLKVSVRESTMAPILVRARTAGVSELPLDLLASTLSK